MHDLISLVQLQTVLDVLIALLALITAVLGGVLFGQLLSGYAPDMPVPGSAQQHSGTGSWHEMFHKRPRDQE